MTPLPMFIRICRPWIGHVLMFTGDVIEDAIIGPVEAQKARGAPAARSAASAVGASSSAASDTASAIAPPALTGRQPVNGLVRRRACLENRPGLPFTPASVKLG
jgi:hypothetical protein